MNTYRVSWSIDVDAPSAVDAARQALAIQRDPDSIATVFDVAYEGDPASSVQVDLQGDT